MRILGVDPGTWRTGAGVIEVSGNRYQLIYAELIEIVEKKPIAQRLDQIHSVLSELIRIYKPDVLALENVFYAKDVKALVKIGEARACAMLAASQNGIGVFEYLPTRVKQAVTGNGRATKQQMQHMVKMLLNLKELPQADTADALAVAICHCHMQGNIAEANNEHESIKPEKLKLLALSKRRGRRSWQQVMLDNFKRAKQG